LRRNLGRRRCIRVRVWYPNRTFLKSTVILNWIQNLLGAREQFSKNLLPDIVSRLGRFQIEFGMTVLFRVLKENYFDAFALCNNKAMKKSTTILIFIFFLWVKNANAQCNGYESLCDKTYDEVAYLTTHNAGLSWT